MNPEQKLKTLIGDLVFQLTVAQSRIEELEKQLAEKESRTGSSENGTSSSS